MLSELCIEDLALIERASLEFGPGLNVITGETGAGKSLLIGALELLLGRRPKAKLVRKGAARARVEGRFFLDPREARSLFAWAEEALPEWAAEHEGERGERELILGRSVGTDGRSRAHVDGRPVRLGDLRALAAQLVEIHGQNDHQRLLDTDEQTRLLDDYRIEDGEHDEVLEAYRAARRAFAEESELALEWTRRVTERRDRIDLLRFQASEFDAIADHLDAVQGLREERALLRHADELAEVLGRVVRDLDEADDSAAARIGRATGDLERFAEDLTGLREPLESLRSAGELLADALTGLARLGDDVQASPERLDELESILAEVDRLARKYATTPDELADRLAAALEELGRWEGQGEDRTEQLARVDASLARLGEAASALSAVRLQAARRLEEAVVESLAALGLERARFEARVRPRDLPAPTDGPKGELDEDRRAALLAAYRPDGADEVEFFLASNPGEDAQPLRRVASGGETARIMLALRRVLAVRRTIPTLVFDEVDSGVGGHLAPRVGEHLRVVGQHHQILCVTHLAAVAACADTHLKVEKAVEEGRTQTVVRPLSAAQRVDEVADMLAGGAGQKTARAEARRLLRR